MNLSHAEEDTCVRGFPTPHPTPALKQATTQQTDPREVAPVEQRVRRAQAQRVKVLIRSIFGFIL